MVKVVAEMSGNHNGSLERAFQIADAAAKADCWALKLQTYTADSITIDSNRDEFIINDSKSLWNGSRLYDLYKKASTPYEWHEKIFAKCRELGIVCFSTPFDVNAVDFLEDLNCPIYKIASFENSDWQLLRKIANTKKPVIMSLGMLPLEEIYESVDLLFKSGCPDLTLLKCTSTYPADPSACNLLTIPDLKKRFPKCKIGLSDHTLGIGVAIASVALGAEVIEKHFTLSRKDLGVDSQFSMDKDEMAMLVREVEITSKALGKVSYDLTEEEKESTKFRRSLYVVADIKAGEVFTEKNIRSIRPFFGVPAKFIDQVIGKKAKRDISSGTPLKMEDVA